MLEIYKGIVRGTEEQSTIDIHPTSKERVCVKMWKILALLICVQVCAHGPMHPRVVGGADALKKSWPMMVSLHNPTCHFCGGSLISKEWVLSAAHCFIGHNYRINEDNIRVYLGKMTQREKNNKEVMINVQKIYTHSSYNAKTHDNDIALLHLSSPVKPNDYKSPVSLLAQGSEFPPDTRSWIIGWGQNEEGEYLPYPGTLQEAEVLVVDHNQCQIQLTQLLKNLRKPKLSHLQITNNMICAGVPGGGVDTCQGGSGGPMMSLHCSQWVQFGITSWGIGCGRPDMPGVYTSISQYKQWITTTIQNHPSQDLPQFVTLSFPCPSSGKKDKKRKG